MSLLNNNKMKTGKDWNHHSCISQEWWLQQMTVIVLLINYPTAQLQCFIGMMIPMIHCFHRTCLGPLCDPTSIFIYINNLDVYESDEYFSCGIFCWWIYQSIISGRDANSFKTFFWSHKIEVTQKKVWKSSDWRPPF